MNKAKALKYRAAIEQAAQSLDNHTALTVIPLHPIWAKNTVYSVGYKVRYCGKLWRALQTHTAQTGWEPENASSLWEQICETHSGTADDPIPYEGNMALEEGLHYVQDYVIYRCTRDTGSPVYNPLRELAGLYVEAV